jgi:hypothetical protein
MAGNSLSPHLSIHIKLEYFARWSQAKALKDLGRATFKLGDRIEAQRHFLDALETAVEAGTVPNALGALTSQADLRRGDGRSEEALHGCPLCSSHPRPARRQEIWRGNCYRNERPTLSAALHSRPVTPAGHCLRNDLGRDIILRGWMT